MDLHQRASHWTFKLLAPGSSQSMGLLLGILLNYARTLNLLQVIWQSIISRKATKQVCYATWAGLPTMTTNTQYKHSPQSV